ncbi:mucin-2-like [Topomyia yanbarensis]|uniref:mucin-2-like n=1 Tax=Topomyia yanbarensis TaxID=2498891 RepID=UPI00273C0FAB|nr:mucin-2-like [Topomyia yanbarensis]
MLGEQMLKLLIAACLVTHGFGRPDVSHILKQNRTSRQQQNKTFHPLDYLAQFKSNPEKQAASEKGLSVFDYLDTFNETEVNNFGDRFIKQKQNDWSKAFRYMIKPSPFKRNTAQNGYIYEKPAVPLPIRPGGGLDFPIHPDGNLIKPVSTQAPEYLPPVEQVPLASSPVDASVATSTQSSYPASILPDVGGTRPNSYPSQQDSSTGTAGYEPEKLTTTIRTTTGYKFKDTTLNPVEDFDIRNSGKDDGIEQSSSQSPAKEQTDSTTENEFTVYPRGPSSTQAETDSSSTQSPFSGYPRETPSPNSPSTESSTDTPFTTVGSTFTTHQTFDNDEGYSYNKPVIPPNLNEVIGEPGDINELATTTSSTTTTRKYNGYNIPPKPLPELVVPVRPSSTETPEGTPAAEISSVEMTTVSPSEGTSSTAAPEYLPPNESNETKQPSETTQQPLAGQTPPPNYPTLSPTYVSVAETTSSTGYSTYKPDSTTFGGYPDRETTHSSGYSSQDTTTSGGFTSPNQETTTMNGYLPPESSSIGSNVPEYNTSPSVPVPSQDNAYPEYSTIDHSPTLKPIDESSSYKPNSGPLNATTSVVDEQKPGSTAAPEYLPPDTRFGTNNNYPSSGNTISEQPSILPIDSGLPRQPSGNVGSDPSQTPMEEIVAEINNLMPNENSPDIYPLPSLGEADTGMRIVVEDMPTSDAPPLDRSPSTVADTITTYHPTSSQRTTPAETDAEESELKPLVAAVEAPSEMGYNYQVPAVPVASHTLDDQGYHYKIPSVPFL